MFGNRRMVSYLGGLLTTRKWKWRTVKQKLKVYVKNNQTKVIFHYSVKNFDIVLTHKVIFRFLV